MSYGEAELRILAAEQEKWKTNWTQVVDHANIIVAELQSPNASEDQLNELHAKLLRVNELIDKLCTVFKSKATVDSPAPPASVAAPKVERAQAHSSREVPTPSASLAKNATGGNGGKVPQPPLTPSPADSLLVDFDSPSPNVTTSLPADFSLLEWDPLPTVPNVQTPTTARRLDGGIDVALVPETLPARSPSPEQLVSAEADSERTAMFALEIPRAVINFPKSGDLKFTILAPVGSPSEFAIDVSGNDRAKYEKYDELKRAIDTHYAKTEHQTRFESLSEFRPGRACIAELELGPTPHYFRGSVLKVNAFPANRVRGQDGELAGVTVTVFFVDVGIVQEIAWTGVYRLAAQFAKLPRRAVQCRLFGVESNVPSRGFSGGQGSGVQERPWSDDALSFFRQKCRTDVEMTGIVLSDCDVEPLALELYDRTDAMSIRQAMIENGFAKACEQ